MRLSFMVLLISVISISTISAAAQESGILSGKIESMTGEALGIVDAQGQALISIATAADANNSIAVVDEAIRQVSTQRADLGAYQNRFEFAQEGVAVAAENLAASRSRITDVDIAEEVVEFVKNQILIQSNSSMLAQANVLPQSALQLLG